MLKLNQTLIQIRNFYALGKSELKVYNPSKLVLQVLANLRDANFIRAVSIIQTEDVYKKNYKLKKPRKFVCVYLNLTDRRLFLIFNSVKFYSTCSRNYNISLKNLRKMIRVDNFYLRYYLLIFTSFGLLTAEEAVKLGCGGVLLCLIKF